MNNYNNIQEDALRMLLSGDDPILNVLRQQSLHIQSSHTENTGAGLYVTFKLSPQAKPIHGMPNFVVNDVCLDIDGLNDGAGAALFVRNGIIDMLEFFTYGEDWPESAKSYDLKYTSWDPKTGAVTALDKESKVRDLNGLRRTPNWPAP